MRNRGAWWRLISTGREWTGRSNGVGGNQKAVECHLASTGVFSYEIPGRSRSEVPFCWQQNCLIRGSLALGRWESRLMPTFVRKYAAPISRAGRAPQNPNREQKANPDAHPVPEKPDRKLNRAIVARNIRLITDNGHEVVSRTEALRRAEAMDLDLVEVDGKQDPPVCKLMDFNRERFKERQREKEVKKRQVERRRLDDLKEVRFSTRTEPNDLDLKAQMAKRLLLKGHRVKLAVVPHGNDELDPKGRDLILRVVNLLEETCTLETGPRVEKQRVWVLIRPTAVGDKSSAKRKKVSPVKSNSLSEDAVDSSEADQDKDQGDKIVDSSGL